MDRLLKYHPIAAIFGKPQYSAKQARMAYSNLSGCATSVKAMRAAAEKVPE